MCDVLFSRTKAFVRLSYSTIVIIIVSLLTHSLVCRRTLLQEYFSTHPPPISTPKLNILRVKAHKLACHELYHLKTDDIHKEAALCKGKRDRMLEYV